MNMHQEIDAEDKECEQGSCHCAVCFSRIDDAASAASSLAGRYYCQQCIGMFRQESLSHFRSGPSHPEVSLS